MRAQALSLTRLSPDDIEGAVLAETIVASNDHRRRLLAKGTILGRDDLPLICQADISELHVVRMESGDIHEDEAARRLAAVVAGEGIEVHGPTESQMRLSAAVNGIFQVDLPRLDALNDIPDLSVFTLFSGQLVEKGKTVAGVKVTPFVIAESRLRSAERVCAGGPGIVRVNAFKPMRVAVLVRERLDVRQRQRFKASIEVKVAWFGSRVLAIRYVGDSIQQVASALSELIREADLVLTAGANATDPLDPTLQALVSLGARMEKQGAPAHPGSAVWLAYLAEKPVFGVAACGMFSRATVLDLVLPRLFAGERLRAADFNRLGHGGLLSSDMRFRFPAYGAFDTLES
jgi:hypothetical protein